MQGRLYGWLAHPRPGTAIRLPGTSVLVLGSTCGVDVSDGSVGIVVASEVDHTFARRGLLPPAMIFLVQQRALVVVPLVNMDGWQGRAAWSPVPIYVGGTPEDEHPRAEAHRKAPVG